jgi:hypothetical protein
MRYNLPRRLAKLKRAITHKQDCGFTLEQLCRSVWHENRQDFLKLAKQSCLSLFIVRFEREDAERQEWLVRHRQGLFR